MVRLAEVQQFLHDDLAPEIGGGGQQLLVEGHATLDGATAPLAAHLADAEFARLFGNPGGG